MIRGEVGWTVQQIVLRPSRHAPAVRLDAVVQFLATPRVNGYTCAVPLTGAWDEPASVDDYEPVMAAMTRAILVQGAPFLDRYGSLDGYLDHLRDQAAPDPALGVDWLDMNTAEELTYLHLVRGDLAAAADAAQEAERSADEDRRHPIPSLWVQRGLDRVRQVMAIARRNPDEARSLLARNAASAAAALALPEPTPGAGFPSKGDGR
ncbi:hypothetical protein ACFFWC_18665 [Plantactinospora siamensis]|uniref:Bacterial transcriptional activator domain-containing protein n=1 Tax=Plantactinospora siamensis TaxID=555372 RepID=A0ABV6P372_9ACTN